MSDMPQKKAVLEQEPVNPVDVIHGYVVQLKSDDDRLVHECFASVLKMKTVPPDYQYAMESENFYRTVMNTFRVSTGNRRLGSLVVLGKLVRSSLQGKETLCTVENADAVWAVLSATLTTLMELEEQAKPPASETDASGEDVDPKVAKDREREREESAKRREQAYHDGVAALGVDATAQGLTVLCQGLRTLLDGRAAAGKNIAQQHLECLRVVLGHSDDTVVLEACRLVEVLSRSTSAARECLKAGHSDKLVQFVTGPASVPVRSAALKALNQLAVISPAQAADLVKRNIARSLLELVSSDANPDSVRALAVRLLATLAAKSATLVEQLWAAGAMPALQALLPRVPGIEEEQPRTLEPVMEASEAEPPAAATKGKKAPPPVAKPAVAKVSSKSQVNRDDQRSRLATPQAESSTVVVPSAPCANSMVQQCAAQVMASVLRLPTLRQRLLAEERERVAHWEQEAFAAGVRPDTAASGGVEAASTSGGTGAALGPPAVRLRGLLRKATVAEVMFYLLTPVVKKDEPAKEDAHPPPHETPVAPLPAKEAGKEDKGKKGDKHHEVEVPEYPDLPDPLRPPFPTEVQIAAAECLQSLALDLRCAQEILNLPGTKSIITSLPDVTSELLGEKLLKVATVILSHVKPKVLEELGLSANVMSLARNFADTRLMLLRNTIGRTTMALRPEYPTRPPPPSPPPSPPAAPDLPRKSVWDTLADMHLASGVAQHT